MRTWGRVPVSDANPSGWIEVTTDDMGSNDYVWITTLCQCLLLILGEDPFFGNYGIPAQQSVIQQIAPDYDVVKTQQQFAPYFASLIITNITPKQQRGQSTQTPTPTYLVNVVTNVGVPMQATVAT